MTLNKAAAPLTRSAMQAHSKQQQQYSWSRASRWLTNKDQKVRDGFSTKMKILCTNFFVPKKIWDTIRYDCCAVSSCRPPLRVLLLFLVHLAGLPLQASCFYFCVVLLRIQGFCGFEFENSAQQHPVWSRVCVVFLYFEFISRLDALHSVRNSLYLHALPMSNLHQQNRFFRGVMTPTLLLVRPGLQSTDVRLLRLSLSLSLESH